MSDGIHLNKESLDKVVDHVIQSVEDHFVLKKRGPTEKAGPADKKPRFSSSSFEGGKGGRGGGGAAGGRAGAVASALSARMGRDLEKFFDSFLKLFSFTKSRMRLEPLGKKLVAV